MNNPVMDQDRAQHLSAKQSASTRKGVLPAWPRDERELPLVELEVTWVRFSTLNHRTKSEQLKIIKSRGKSDLFSADPMGETAQKEQLAILVKQEGFEDLKDDLKERGQQEPAIVTAEGILINGNRRAAALRSLFVDDDHIPSRYLKCLVLPADATAAELVDLETELQIARDFKEDYTWVNEALLIEELFDREGKDWARVAKRMHKTHKYIKEQFEKLQQLHQLVDLSNGTRFHADFVPNESAFTELAKHVSGKPAEEAASVRNAYFLGTLTGVNYRTLRRLRRPDASEMINREIINNPSLVPLLEIENSANDTPTDILDDVLGSNIAGAATELGKVLAVFAKAGGSNNIDLGGTPVATEELMGSVRDAVDAAAEEAANQDDDDFALAEPINQLKKSIRAVAKSADSLPRARTYAGWNEQRFKNALKELNDAVENLGKIR